MNESYLRDKGFVQQPDGSWSKPKSGQRLAVHPVQTVQQKQNGVSPLDAGKPRRERRKGHVKIVISLIACRVRECDDDGNVAGLFHWRDAIANALGIDDGDKRIRWQYGQIETRGETGVMVKIEAV